MANILLYDPNDENVAERVTGYYLSVHTPSYDSEPNKIVNPDLSGVSGVEEKYWKVSGGSVVAMLQSERDIIDGLTPSSTTGNYDTLTFSTNTKISSWKSVKSFVYQGEQAVGTPHTIEIIGRVDTGVTGDFRLFDKENGVVLATATLTNNIEQRISATIISDWPQDSSIIEVQIKRTVGTNNKEVFLNGMFIGY